LIHRAKDGEHPGYMAGGEYPVDDYYEMIKRQMKKIEEDLEKIRNDREIHRQTRYKSGFYLVSLAGYTHAGKSSLLNLLTGEKVKVDGRLFSTLSTTTRKISPTATRKKIPVLLTDTVGFIENLPAWIIDAFHSTLEEIEVADVILLVIDGSEDVDIVKKKLRVSLHELRDLGVTAPILIAMNKIDLVTKEEVDHLIHEIHYQELAQKNMCIPVSVKEQRNIDLLLDKVYESLPNMIKLQLCLPLTKESQSFVSYLYDTTQVIDIKYSDVVTITVECNAKIKEKILLLCHQHQGTIL
jgi:GTP-binding protein HflX